MTKRWLTALEKVFAAEIEGRLSFQSKAGVFVELREAGLLEDDVQRWGKPPFVCKVRGFALTHAGRIAYCETCK